MNTEAAEHINLRLVTLKKTFSLSNHMGKNGCRCLLRIGLCAMFFLSAKYIPGDWLTAVSHPNSSFPIWGLFQEFGDWILLPGSTQSLHYLLQTPCVWHWCLSIPQCHTQPVPQIFRLKHYSNGSSNSDKYFPVQKWADPGKAKMGHCRQYLTYFCSSPTAPLEQCHPVPA